jgi:hypothetical protein
MRTAVMAFDRIDEDAVVGRSQFLDAVEAYRAVAAECRTDPHEKTKHLKMIQGLMSVVGYIYKQRDDARAEAQAAAIAQAAILADIRAREKKADEATERDRCARLKAARLQGHKEDERDRVTGRTIAKLVKLEKEVSTKNWQLRRHLMDLDFANDDLQCVNKDVAAVTKQLRMHTDGTVVLQTVDLQADADLLEGMMSN